MTFTLGDIRQVVRNVTGSPSTSQLTDSTIDDYINKFYRFVLPDESKPFRLLVDYRFYTLQNQVEYTFDLNTYVSLEPEFFINGNRLLYYQDQSLWLRDFQYQYNQSTATSGDGFSTVFIGTAPSVPIVPGSVIFTDDVEVFSDNEDGTLTGSLGGSGTINYTSGAYSITFNSPPASGQAILLTEAPIINGMPRAMYYDGNGNIQFSPIPDQSYLIEGRAYMMPTAFIQGGNSNQTPLITQWGYVIAYGASLEIFRQRGQLDQVNMYRPEYDKYLDLATSRSTQQYSNQRTVPKW
jgi:hypothetical protein